MTPPEIRLRTVSIVVVIFMIIILCLAVSSCSKYQVVQKLDVNMYHLHNRKNQKVEVIITQDELQLGKYYRLNQIEIIDLDKEKTKIKNE